MVGQRIARSGIATDARVSAAAGVEVAKQPRTTTPGQRLASKPSLGQRLAGGSRLGQRLVGGPKLAGRTKLGVATRMPPQGQVRLALLCALFLGCAIVLVYRLYTFQVLDSTRYQQLADDERHAQIPIIPNRGAMLDTNGNPLVVSVRYDSVYVLGTLVGRNDRADKLAATLSPVLDLPVSDIRAAIDTKNGRPVVLKSGVPSAVAQQVQALALPGVYLDKEPKRQYPEGSLAAQILGFVGRDFNGLGGLELSYQDELAGTPGVIDTEKDTAGQEIALGRRLLTPPRQGSDLVLTIDRYVQRVAERLLNQAVLDNKAMGGLILVMEPSTGNILAAANNPTYNLTADEIYNPNQADLYKSKIVTDQYEPGSTLKTLAMSAALDMGLVTPGTTMDDTGIAHVGGATIRNWNGAANGISTMTDILIHSSNVGMTWVSGKLGADPLYDYYARYGLGQPTGLRLPGEVAGTVRTNKDEGWTRVDQATNAYGQGIAVTPVQLLQAVSVFANEGKLVRPRLVRAIRGPDGMQDLPSDVERQVISSATARSMLQMMVAVHEQPDLKPYRVPGYHLAAKTGTADTPTNVGYNTALTVGSLVSLFPAEAPRFAVLIRLDGPEKLYGGVVAAPVLKDLAQELLTYYRVPPSS
jgi:cell division protein FtsI/penicillin-binding protein 2